MSAEVYQQPEPGSQWYLWGKHWLVIGPAERDGEEAVRLQSARNRKAHRNELLRTFARKAGRSGE